MDKSSVIILEILLNIDKDQQVFELENGLFDELKNVLSKKEWLTWWDRFLTVGELIKRIEKELYER